MSKECSNSSNRCKRFFFRTPMPLSQLQNHVKRELLQNLNHVKRELIERESEPGESNMAGDAKAGGNCHAAPHDEQTACGGMQRKSIDTARQRKLDSRKVAVSYWCHNVMNTVLLAPGGDSKSREVMCKMMQMSLEKQRCTSALVLQSAAQEKMGILVRDENTGALQRWSSVQMQRLNDSQGSPSPDGVQKFLRKT